MKISSIFALASAVFALAAAALWFLSVSGKVPRMGSYWDGVPDTDPFYRAIKKGAELNRWAATAAGLSALAGAIGTFLDQAGH